MIVDVEKIIIDYINENVDTNEIFCADTIPNPRPKNKVITVEATGGNSSQYETMDETTVAVQFIAPTRVDALNMARQVHSFLPNMADDVVSVLSVSQGTPYNWTDREPRYQLVVNVRTKNE